MPSPQPHPFLFCKPDHSHIEAASVLFSKHYQEVYGTISFRSLNLKNDLPLIHKWVQQDYAIEYWQMNGHFSQLFAIYQCMELNPYSHSFIGLYTPRPEGRGYSAGNIICQFDVYSVFADELKEHINVEPNDCGFHLLMAPNKNPVHGLTSTVIKAFLDYYFSFPEAKRMYAEPDINNIKSIALLERAGFQRIKTVEMSYKRALIYCLEKIPLPDKSGSE